MKINRTNAMQLRDEFFGDVEFAEDFHGNLMCRSAYGDPDYFVRRHGQAIYCGWNIHHILPRTHGGTNAVENLICTNILTNESAADKITYWIDDSLYQVQRIFGSHRHQIVRLA